MAMGAMDTHKYYGGSGSFADRRKTWEDLGLGTAAEYQDTATQNAQLVSAMNANKGLTLAGSQSATPAATPAANTAAAASSSSSAQPTVASYASQSQQIAEQLKQPFNYDPANDTMYQAYQQMKEGVGTYDNNGLESANQRYEQQMDALGQYDRNAPQAIYDNYIAQRNALGPFAYDYANDPSYQAYERQYTNAGKRAMEDTLAQVAARTGGLASSYAGAAAQQQYNRYMTELGSIIPQLEQIAYSRYRDQLGDLDNDYARQLAIEGANYNRYRDSRSDIYDEFNRGIALDELGYGRYRDAAGDARNDFAALNDLNNTTYSRYSDDWNRNYQTGRDAINDARYDTEYADSRSDAEWERNYRTGRDEIADRQWQDTFNYNREQDALDNAYRDRTFNYNMANDSLERLTSLISMGYTPTDAELAALGMTRAQANAIANYALQQMAANRSSGSSGSSGGGSGNDEYRTTPASEKTVATITNTVKNINSDREKREYVEKLVEEKKITPDQGVAIIQSINPVLLNPAPNKVLQTKPNGASGGTKLGKSATTK